MNAKPKHTPEPWLVIFERETAEVQPDEQSARLRQAHAREVTDGSIEALAFPLARVLACVNACAGLDPAAIPALVEAAERVGQINEGDWIAEDANAMDDLRAELAKVRGGR